MSTKSRLELSVGIFIIFGIIIMIAFVFLIRDFQIVKPGYKFNIVFGFANGVKMSAPVRLSGVDVGEIKSIKIFYDPGTKNAKVNINVWVSQDTKIPADSEVWINTLGLLGEKYIEILPGKNYGQIVSNNDTIFGQDPVSMEEITKETKKLVLKFDQAIGSFDQALGGLNDALTKVNSGQGTIGKFIYDETIYNNLEAMSEDLKSHPWKLLFKPKEKPVGK